MRYILLFLALASAASAQVSPDGIWSAMPPAEVETFVGSRADAAPRVNAARYRLVRLNEPAFARATSSMPLERLDLPPAQRPAGGVITMPLPDGSFARFEVVESPVMEPDLAARYPQIRTYTGRGIDDRAATIRFDKTPGGFHAQILSPKGAVYIDPYYDEEAYIVFQKTDYLPESGFQCFVEGSLYEPRTTFGEITRSGSQLRTYRLAMACTGEYAQYHGGTVQDALSAIVTTVNRVTGIYERELAIRFTLVADNDQIIFTNPATDGYTNDDAFALLNENQAKLDAIITNSNYDIGHVVSTGGGGLANLGVVCVSGWKAKGETGLPSPEGDVFDVDYVSHEIGHQFDGDHTFNGVSGSCSGSRRVGPSAYEPGSGSTIQAYAGICGSDNLQSNSDPYFHAHSFQQMYAYSIGSGDCASLSATGNSEPTADAGPNYVIPRATPFTLTGAGFDADDDDLTYCWEQRDLGPAASLAAPDDGLIPLFRSMLPSSSPSRTFPQWPTILSNTVDNAEKLPQQSRAMDFRLTVRDNGAPAGGVATDDMVVNVDASKGPFAVTYPNGGEPLVSEAVVTWDVAGTTGSPINTAVVDIVLSLDSGATFDLVLADDTPNDGAELVALPNTSSSTARIMVRAEGNIYFDVSNADFQIAPVILDDVYVDFAYAGVEAGTEAHPFDVVSKALAAVSDAGTIWVAPGSSTEQLTIDDAVTIRLNGVGTATIGSP